MTYLKNKSIQSLEAAELIEQTELHSVIPHCSYYSCIQLIKYQLNYTFGIDYESQNKERIAQQLNTHQYLIKKFIELSKRRATKEDIRCFENDIKVLKTIREDADYEDIPLDKVKYKQTINKAKELNKFIIKLKF